MENDTTESLCPVCLKRIGAQRVARGRQVQLVKTCPDHGEFRVVVWSGRPNLKEWRRAKTPILLQSFHRPAERGCPFDCGLCRQHRQRSCTVLLEVTRRCNLNCPICFAGSYPGKADDPSLEEIGAWYETVGRMAAGSNIQLSGGEPTLRDDLPAIVAAGRRAGFKFIQLNTNGLRLAEDAAYVKALKGAGLSSVFLQFDGTQDAVYLKLRGRRLAEVKRRATAACAAHAIGVVLVPTLVPGVNTAAVGEVLRTAVEMSPVVRGVHFQPVSYFGRYPRPTGAAPRITLPELMAAIERQSDGGFKVSDFRPPGCENAWCSFHADYLVLPGGGVRRLQAHGRWPADGHPIPAEEGALRSMAHVSRQWAAPTGVESRPSIAEGEEQGADSASPPRGPMRLDDFLRQARSHTLTVSAMAFQDAWTIDLERLRDCCIHVFDPRHGLVPFCAYNLTAVDGRSLYRQ